MNKKTKALSIILIINILISIIFNLYTYKSFAAATVQQTISTDIEAIDEEKYPGIKQKIKDLQEKHPKWNFKVLYAGLKWEDVVNGENATHGTNVVSKSSYGNEWICSKCGKDNTYSGGAWYCASTEAVKYMMDARNSLNESDVFQFLELSYDKEAKYEKSAVKEILSKSFLDDGKLDIYVDQIFTSCEKYNVNPYYVAAKIIQEQGKQGGSTFKMVEQFGNGIFKLNTENNVLTVLQGATVGNISEYLDKVCVVKNTDGKKVTDKKQVLSTGYKVDDKYTVAVLGDVNGDGKVKSTDYMRIKNYILKKSKLSDAEMAAADVNEDGKVKSTDYMRIKNYILKKAEITLKEDIYYYNIFNIRASGKTTEEVISNAFNKAKAEGWTTIEKCLETGIEFIGGSYISIGQNTMYFEKFNVVNTTKGYSYYTHQYAQDLLYAQNQGTKLKAILEGIEAVDYPYTFVIPLYEGMTLEACERPASK